LSLNDAGKLAATTSLEREQVDISKGFTLLIHSAQGHPARRVFASSLVRRDNAPPSCLGADAER